MSPRKSNRRAVEEASLSTSSFNSSSSLNSSGVSSRKISRASNSSARSATILISARVSLTGALSAADINQIACDTHGISKIGGEKKCEKKYFKENVEG